MANAFCEKIKAIRKEMGWSQEESAKIIGTSTAFYNQMEMGKRNPIDDDKLKAFLTKAAKEEEFDSLSALAKIFRASVTINLTDTPEELAFLVNMIKVMIEKKAVDITKLDIGTMICSEELKILYEYFVEGDKDEGEQPAIDPTFPS